MPSFVPSAVAAAAATVLFATPPLEASEIPLPQGVRDLPGEIAGERGSELSSGDPLTVPVLSPERVAVAAPATEREPIVVALADADASDPVMTQLAQRGRRGMRAVMERERTQEHAGSSDSKGPDSQDSFEPTEAEREALNILLDELHPQQRPNPAARDRRPGSNDAATPSAGSSGESTEHPRHHHDPRQHDGLGAPDGSNPRPVGVGRAPSSHAKHPRHESHDSQHGHGDRAHEHSDHGHGYGHNSHVPHDHDGHQNAGHHHGAAPHAAPPRGRAHAAGWQPGEARGLSPEQQRYVNAAATLAAAEARTLSAEQLGSRLKRVQSRTAELRMLHELEAMQQRLSQHAQAMPRMNRVREVIAEEQAALRASLQLEGSASSGEQSPGPGLAELTRRIRQKQEQIRRQSLDAMEADLRSRTAVEIKALSDRFAKQQRELNERLSQTTRRMEADRKDCESLRQRLAASEQERAALQRSNKALAAVAAELRAAGEAAASSTQKETATESKAPRGQHDSPSAKASLRDRIATSEKKLKALREEREKAGSVGIRRSIERQIGEQERLLKSLNESLKQTETREKAAQQQKEKRDAAAAKRRNDAAKRSGEKAKDRAKEAEERAKREAAKDDSAPKLPAVGSAMTAPSKSDGSKSDESKPDCQQSPANGSDCKKTGECKKCGDGEKSNDCKKCNDCKKPDCDEMTSDANAADAAAAEEDDIPAAA